MWINTLRKYVFREPSAASVSTRAVEAQLDVPYCSIARILLSLGSTAAHVNIRNVLRAGCGPPTLNYGAVHLNGFLGLNRFHGQIALI
jgi:hypothetical protein